MERIENNEKKGIVIYGPPMSGKTQLLKQIEKKWGNKILKLSKLETIQLMNPDDLKKIKFIIIDDYKTTSPSITLMKQITSTPTTIQIEKKFQKRTTVELKDITLIITAGKKPRFPPALKKRFEFIELKGGD